MTRQPYPFSGPVPGYCDALPSGERVILHPGSHIETYLGRVELPDGQNVLYLRLTLAGGFGICGVGHDGDIKDLAMQWRDGQWSEHGLTSGTSSVMFDAIGNLLVVRPGAGVTSQGYRQLDDAGNVVFGDSTYADPARRIWEYSTVAGVTFGQGGDSDPLIVLIDGQRRQLEPGPCRFIRASHANGLFAISCVKPGEAVQFWLTRAELERLPLADAPIVVPPVVVPPVTPPVEPPKEPHMDFPINEWRVVEEMHRRFAGSFPANEDGAREWTKKTIQQLKANFPDGGWCWKSADPHRPPSKDGIARRVAGRPFEGWDVISAAGANGPRNLAPYPPAYHDLTGQHPIDVEPLDSLGGGTVTPPKPPANDDDDDDKLPTWAEVMDHLKAMTRRIDAHGEIIDAHERELGAHDKALAKVGPAPDLSEFAKRGDRVSVKLFGQTARGTIDK